MRATTGSLRPDGRHWRGVIPKDAHGIQLVRIVNEEFRYYEAFEFGRGASGIETFLNQQMLSEKDTRNGDYGVIDILADDGYSVMADIGIADAAVFQRIKKKLGARVVPQDEAASVSASGRVSTNQKGQGDE